MQAMLVKRDRIHFFKFRILQINFRPCFWTNLLFFGMETIKNCDIAIQRRLGDIMRFLT